MTQKQDTARLAQWIIVMHAQGVSTNLPLATRLAQIAQLVNTQWPLPPPTRHHATLAPRIPHLILEREEGGNVGACQDTLGGKRLAKLARQGPTNPDKEVWMNVRSVPSANIPPCLLKTPNSLAYSVQIHSRPYSWAALELKIAFVDWA